MKIVLQPKTTLLTCLSMLAVIGTSQPTIVNLSNSNTGLQLYEASQEINLLPGFDYNNSISGDFTARIVSSNGQSYAFTETTESTTLPVVTTYPVGSLVGIQNVSQTGGATYTIPISVAPGIGSMVPGVSVNYNSQAGEGLIGLGWSLSGLSCIKRAPSDLYHETEITNIQFNANDHFALDGQRLIAYSSTEYRTEVESFSRITFAGSVGNPTSFTVETKDGKTLEYGNTTDSRVEAQGRSEGLIWNLNKITDKNGNYITITYYENNTTGESYPLTINYTGTTSLSPFNSITFDYVTRNTPIESYVSGSKITLGHLLSNINIVNEGTTVHRYNFQYNTITSRLIEIIEYGKNNSRLNPTTVSYGTADVGLNQSTSYTDPTIGGRFFGDFNGDGRTDMTILRNGLYYLYLANDDGVLSLAEYRGFPSFDVGDDKVLTGDFNGDGMMDFVSFYSYNISFTLSRGTYFETVYTQQSFSDPVYKHFIGDFNGDGISDLLTKTSNNVALIYAFNVNQQTYSLLASSTAVTWGDDTYSEIQDVLVDVNGNGKTDLMTVDGSGCRFYELQNGSIIQLFSSSYPTTSNIYLFGDINGDRKTDLFSFGPTNQDWKVCLSTGIGFIQTNNSIFSGFDQYVFYNNFYCRDVNGDGRSDIIVVGRGTSIYNPVKVFTGISNGQSLTLQTYTPSTALLVDPTYNAIYDFNGDGTTDFYYCNTTSGYLFSIYRGKNQDLVSSITNGFGQDKGFNYKPISDASVYTKGTSSIYPVMDYKGPLYVVSSAWSDNNNNTQTTTNYTYNSARIHVKGKGFLGFAAVTSDNPTMNIKIINQYGFNTTYYNIFLNQSNVYTSGNSPISQSVLTNSLIEYGNKRILPYVSQVVDNDYLASITKTTASVIDNNGNPSSVTETYDDGSYNTVSYLNYTSYGSWMLWKPQTVNTTRKHYSDASNFSLTSAYTYNSNTGLVLTEVTGPITTTYQYNADGNVSYVTQSSDGTNRVTHLVYDNKGRFVTDFYNALNHHTQRLYDNATGNIVSETAPNNQITSYTYDNFGRLATITYPTNQVVSVSYQWATGTRPLNAMYFILTSSIGLPSAKEYYDAFGRVIKTEESGFNGTSIYTNTVYDTKGRVINQTLPYYSGQQPFARGYSYDDFNRITIDAGSTAITTYTYAGKTTQIVSGGLSSSKTADSQGNLISTTDAGGTMTYTYKSIGQPGTITTNNSTWTMVYDSYGRQTQLSDPDAGTTFYGYNGFGELTSQTDAMNNNLDMTYDALGRLYTRVGSEGTTTYFYDPSNNPGLLDYVTYPGGSETYVYDTYGRMTSKSKVINDGTNTTYSTGYTYNTKGQLTSMTYPSNFAVSYGYNTTTGYLTEIRRSDNNALIWQCNSMNALGDLTQYTYGNSLVTTKTYDNFSNLQGKQTTNSVQNLSYSFDPMTGNLQSRSDVNRSLTETFAYDNLNRLTGITGPASISTSFSANGNITSKTDAGTYSYGTLPHAVTGVTNPQGIITTEQDVTYNSFNKTQSLTEGVLNLQFTYDQNQQRTISKLYQNGTLQKTVYYLGNYEKEVSGSTTRQLNYIAISDGVAAIYDIVNGTGTMYYVHTDHLGSFNAVTNASGSPVESNSFDAWGRRRNASNWTYSGLPSSYLFSRGYTGHEHIDNFQLINMNGRMYDPLLGRMLATDDFVQLPDFSQSYNRYSYCFNNPLIYTDANGENPLLIAIAALVGAYFGGKTMNNGEWNPGQWNWSSGGTYGGIIIGGIAGGVGGAIGTGAIGGLSGLDAAMMGGMAAGAINGGGMTAISGGSFGDIIGGTVSGAVMGGFSAAAGYGLMVGVSAGANAIWDAISYGQGSGFGDLIRQGIGSVPGFAYRNTGMSDVVWKGLNLPSGIIPNMAMSINGALAGSWGRQLIPAARIYTDNIGSGFGFRDWWQVTGPKRINDYVSPNSLTSWYNGLGINDIRILQIKKVKGNYNADGTLSRFTLNGMTSADVLGRGSFARSDVYGGYGLGIQTLGSPNPNSIQGPSLYSINRARVYRKYGPGFNPWWRQAFFGIRY